MKCEIKIDFFFQINENGVISGSKKVGFSK